MNARDFGFGELALLLTGPIIGSFLGVVVRRLPEGEAIVRARSRCENCGVALLARDLVPIASWLVGGGRCRHCGIRLGWFYPAIEIAATVIAAAALAVDGMPGALTDSLFGWWLLALAWIDVRRWLLPDGLTLPLIAAGLGVAAAFNPAELVDNVLGAALGYAVLRAAAAGYRAWRGVEGLGGGDAKLLAASGAWVGALALPQVIAAAAIAALCAAGAMHLAGRRVGARTALPFGPFLALATWLIWLFGPVQ